MPKEVFGFFDQLLSRCQTASAAATPDPLRLLVSWRGSFRGTRQRPGAKLAAIRGGLTQKSWDHVENHWKTNGKHTNTIYCQLLLENIEETIQL